MDIGTITAFFMTATGALVLIGLGIILWKILGKGTGEYKGWMQTGGKIMAVVGCLLLVIPIFGVGFTATPPPPPDGEIDTDYSIVFVLDSSTAVISSDFAQTDEIAAGEYSFSYDEEGNTKGITVKNTCTALSACTWDAFSFTITITANFPSEWDMGARKTAVLDGTIDSSIRDWGLVSNRTSINVPFVDRSPLDQSGLVWVDGAGANKAVGALSGQLNEFSPGESVTSTGLYWAVNEDQYSTLYNVPTGIWSENFNIVFSDDFGFSHTVILSIQLTTA